MSRLISKLCFGMLAFVAAIHASAQELKIGLKQPVAMQNNNDRMRNPSVMDHIYEPLVVIDDHGAITPGLAESWKMIDPLTWEFKLRKGVKFHNGQELTSEDVVWSLNKVTGGNEGNVNRVKKPTSVGNFVMDKYTVKLGLDSPTPNLISQLSSIYISSKKVEFGGGNEQIGTGPYRYVKQDKTGCCGAGAQ